MNKELSDAINNHTEKVIENREKDLIKDVIMIYNNCYETFYDYLKANKNGIVFEKEIFDYIIELKSNNEVKKWTI